MYIQIILNLLLVIGLICVYMFITWKIKGIKNPKNQLIEVISILGIGTKEKIMLLKVEGRKILVGATANNITILADLEPSTIQANSHRLADNFADKLQEATNSSLVERN